MRVIIVRPYDKPVVADIDNTLQAKQAVVGGDIEMVCPPSHTDSACLICNEEGKLLGLPPNRPLTLPDGTLYDVICGTFLICDAPIDSDDFASLTDAQVERYLQLYA